MHGFLVRTDRKIGLFKSILKGEFHSFLCFEEIHFLRVDHYELAGIFQARVDAMTAKKCNKKCAKLLLFLLKILLLTVPFAAVVAYTP